MNFGTHKGYPIILILRRINPITRTDSYFLKVHTNIVAALFVSNSWDDGGK